MALVSDLDPTQPTTEDDALRAFDALRGNSPTLDDLTATDGPTLRQVATDTLRSYRDQNQGKPLFPSLNARREQQLRGLFTEDPANVLSPEKYTAMEQRAATSTDPEAYKARLALKAYIQDQTGKQVLPHQYTYARTALAKALELDDTSDKAVFNAIRGRYQEHDKATEVITVAAGQLRQDALAGDFIGQSDAIISQAAAKIPERLRADAVLELSKAYRDALETRRRAAPMAGRLARFMGFLAGREEEASEATAGEDTQFDPGNLEEAVDDLLALDPDTRAAAIGQASKVLEGLQSEEGFDEATVENAMASIGSLSRDAIQLARALLFAGSAQAAGVNPSESGSFQEFDERFRTRAAILQGAASAPTFAPSDNWGRKAVLSAGKQAPIFASIWHPASMGALTMSLAGGSVQGQRVSNPQASFEAQLATGSASGVAQMGIETVLTRGAFKLLQGKAPTVAGMLSKAGIRNKYGRAAVGAPLLIGGAAGTEYAEEIAQDATDRMLSDLATELSGFNSETDWGEFFHQWNPRSGSAQSQEVLFAVVPFALIGAGIVGSYQEFKYGDWLQQSRPILRAIGIPEPVITEIQEADPKTAANLTREAFQTEIAIDQEVRIEEARGILRDMAQLYQDAGLPIVYATESFDGTESWVFQSNPLDQATAQEFQTEDEAFAAWEQARTDIEADALEAIIRAGTEATVDTLAGEGSAMQGKLEAVPLDQTSPTLSEASQRKDAFGNPIATPEQIEARVHEFMLQGGQSRDVEGLRIKAKRFAQKMRDGTFRQVLQYFSDTDPLAIVEDAAESFLDQSLRDGFLTEEEVRAWIDQTAAATGQNYGKSLIEGFSAIVRDFTLARVNSEELPAEFREWVAASAVHTGLSISYGNELRRAPSLAKALEEGRIDAKFEALLADAIGINVEERNRRLEAQYQDELAAEAMEGIPEIQDSVKGRLPHPRTLRDNDHPLAGDVQRIFDGLKRPTRRKRKDGGTVDSTRAANAFFLPYGEKADLDDVRQHLNEEGFSFDTINDMLDAVDDSVNYGIRHHATGRIDQPSFSFGYRIAHQSNKEDPSIDRAHELVGEDIYGPQASRYFGAGQAGEAESLDVLRRVRGNPDAPVTVYRVVPDFVDEINPGDWVTISRKAAESMNFPEFLGRDAQGNEQTPKILEKTIPASEITWPGDSLLEQGYWPANADESFALGDPFIPADPFPTSDLLLVDVIEGRVTWEEYTEAEKENGKKIDAWIAKIPDDEVLAWREGDRYYTLTPNITGENGNGWRVTGWDNRGAFGHAERSSKREALENFGNVAAADEFVTEIPAPTDSSFALSRSTVTPAQDAAYMQAVEAGDMATAQAMVDKAAELAMPHSHVREDLPDAEVWKQSYRPAGPLMKRFHGGKKGITAFSDTQRRERSAYNPDSLHSEGIWTASYASPANEEAWRDYDARTYAQNEQDGGEVYRLFLNITNPASVVDTDAHHPENRMEALKAQGYDGAHMALSGVWVAFDPAQVKSADPVTYDEQGNPVPLSERFNEQDNRISFALSPSSLNRLEGVIAKKMLDGPQERADYYNRVRDRLAGVLIRYQEHALPSNADNVDLQRRAMTEAIEEAKAIVAALPPEVRGHVNLPISEVLGAKTQRGRVSSMVRLIEEADKALEAHLRETYFEGITKLLDLAKPNLNPATKKAKGRLTPDTQREVEKIFDVIHMTPAELYVRTFNTDNEIGALERQIAGTDPEETSTLKKLSADLVEKYQIKTRLDLFGALAEASASDLARAHDALLILYKEGRYARNILDDQRRQEIQAARRDIIDNLNPVDSNTWSRKTKERGFGAAFKNWRLGHYSFHQFVEELFPKSAWMREQQQRARNADNQVKRALIDARDRWENFARTELDLPKRGWKFGLAKKLAKLSERRDWDIEIKEGVKFVEESLEEEQALAILDGKMKTGWHNDPIAMQSLRQALADFRMMREKEKKRVQKVRFRRLKSRGKPSRLHHSDLEALYILQLAGQKEYLPTLDAHGFTDKVLKQIEAQIAPEALWLGDYLAREYAQEYDRLNPVFRQLYGYDMPKVRNYAPAAFEHMGRETDLDTETGAGQGPNAMSAGFTATRQNHMARPQQRNALAQYWGHLENVEYFIAWAELVRDMSAVFRSPDVRRSMEGNFGKRTTSDLYKWLEVLETDGRRREQGAAFDAAMTAKMQASLAATGLAFNVGSVMKQAQAALNGTLEMTHAQFFDGLRRALKDPEVFSTVWNSHSIQQRVEEGMSPEDKKILDAANAKPSIILEAYRAGRLPLAWGDAVATTLYASAAYAHHYNQAKTQGKKSDAAAREYAMEKLDQVVKKTAQPATTQDRSLAENTTGPKGILLGYMFRSDLRQKLAIAMRSIQEFKAGKISAADLTRRLFYSWLLYGFMNEALGDIWQGISREDDDEDRWHWRDYLASAIAGPMSGGGIIGTFADAILRSSIGTGSYGGKTLADSAGDIGSGGRFAKKLLDDEDNTFDELLAAALGDARNLSTVLGALDPRFAAGAVTLRTIRDAAGVIDNMTETETERADHILDRYRSEQKDDREARAEAREQPAYNLNPQERKLKSLTVERRAQAIAEIAGHMDAARRELYLARLEAVKLLTPRVKAAMNAAEN